jgi:hypothetical protein
MFGMLDMFMFPKFGVLHLMSVESSHVGMIDSTCCSVLYSSRTTQ